MNKKVTFFPFIIIILFFLSFSNEPNNILIIKGKEVKVKGNTTIGSFNCSNIIYKKDTINLTKYNLNKIDFKLNVVEYECGNKLLNRDFQKTLKSDKNPVINVLITDIKPKRFNYYCNLEVIITGKSIFYNNVILNKSKNQLEGNIDLNFSQLGLEPPSKLGGLLKVKDEIIINFKLLL